jgi:hypothetical protein
VKYRGLVDLAPFACIAKSSFIHGVCCDKAKSYLLNQAAGHLGTTTAASPQFAARGRTARPDLSDSANALRGGATTAARTSLRLSEVGRNAKALASQRLFSFK